MTWKAPGPCKCLRLMEMERELGFRSSFNFIPEGDYEVSADLRDGSFAKWV